MRRRGVAAMTTVSRKRFGNALGAPFTTTWTHRYAPHAATVLRSRARKVGPRQLVHKAVHELHSRVWSTVDPTEDGAHAHNLDASSDDGPLTALPTPVDIIASRSLGAIPLPGGGVVFRVWQPDETQVYVAGTFSKKWAPIELLPEPAETSVCFGTGAHGVCDVRRLTSLH